MHLARHARTFALATVLKVLLISGYRSTDFEVHRNWLAVTYNRPPSEWYFEATSQWTLDYPPYFAWFQRLLAAAAAWAAPSALELSAEPVVDSRIIAFQRISVMVADLLLLLGVSLWHGSSSGSSGKSGTQARDVITALILFNPGLLLLDHIHFQYNGMLLGLLLCSLALFRGGYTVAGSAAFVGVVCSKHIFLYAAPLLGVYALATTIEEAGASVKERVVAVARLAAACAAVGAAALLSLCLGGTRSLSEITQQLIQRLFPFQRGLVHTYWAPNVWALYLTADKVGGAGCNIAARRLPTLASLVCSSPSSSASSSSSSASALSDDAGAAEVKLQVLPTITPGVCAALALVFMLPVLWRVWRRPSLTRALLPLAVAHCWLTAFLFGWHVHEKAALYALIPLWLCASADAGLARIAWRASLPVTVGLLPLLFTPLEQVFAPLAVLTAAVGSWYALQALYPADWPPLSRAECAYCAALVLVRALTATHTWLLPQLPFAHLLLTSVVCALGIAEAWLTTGRTLMQRLV